METGKRICQVLKNLRKRIADANEIPFEIEECTHKGDCPGTCPKCESELRYLMESINQREQEGKPVVVDGLMSEAELHQAFDIKPICPESPQEPEEFVLLGMPAPPSDTMRLMGDIAAPSNSDFAAIIARELLAKTDGNIVFSPVGLCRMLEMLQEGMDYDSPIYERVNQLILGFNSNLEPTYDENFRLEHASSIWYNKSMGTIHEDYIDILEHGYDAEAHHANFAQKEHVKQNIDKWVSDNTHQMIKSLDTEIGQDALMLVLDAIYMNGKWESPFDPDYTETDTFYNEDGSETDVEMMYQNIEEAEYAETEKYQVIRLPYRDHAHSMVLVLPKEGISIESIMETVDWMDDETDICEVDFYMPRFRFDNTLSFEDVLRELGLGNMFDKDDCFPKITDEPVHISQIKQQCVINVEEEGTEAAALTIAECDLGCPPPDEMLQPLTMRLDRPFAFAITGEYDELLFMGVVKNLK